MWKFMQYFHNKRTVDISSASFDMGYQSRKLTSQLAGWDAKILNSIQTYHLKQRFFVFAYIHDFGK